jgi:hypothetical protein
VFIERPRVRPVPQHPRAVRREGTLRGRHRALIDRPEMRRACGGSATKPGSNKATPTDTRRANATPKT